MGADDVVGILGQVRIRYETARQFFLVADYDAVDKELSELRDVLDDCYDRPEEDVKARIIAAAQQEIPSKQE